MKVHPILKGSFLKVLQRGVSPFVFPLGAWGQIVFRKECGGMKAVQLTKVEVFSMTGERLK